MEPVTTSIIAALVAGATAAAKDVATDSIKSAFAGLKRLISDRYSKAGPFVDAVTSDPDSKPEQQVLAKQIEQTGASKDDEIRQLALKLLDEIHGLKNDQRASALFDFGGILKARNFELNDIEALGPVLRVAKDATFEGDFKATGIRQPGGEPGKKKAE
jgi:hypothetical protein